MTLFDSNGNAMKSLYVFNDMSGASSTTSSGSSSSSSSLDGTYCIYTGATGYSKVVDVAGKSTADGANILQYAYKGTTNQKFYIEEVKTGVYAIKTAITGGNSCLDVYGWSTSAGGNIAQWTYWGGNCQLWYLEATSE